ncbi:MAG: hypothetical protein RBT19_15045 [Tenuifilaceae bacterium]|nr:hypothetical protein [Tenuifilaceae bacterium]
MARFWLLRKQGFIHQVWREGEVMEEKTVNRSTIKIIRIIALFIGIIIPLALSGCAKTVPVHGRNAKGEIQEKNISTSGSYTLSKANLEVISFPITASYYTFAAFEENIVAGMVFTTFTVAISAVGIAILPVSFVADTIMLPHILSQDRQPFGNVE